MYLIEVTHSAAQAAIGAIANTAQYVPADRCTWRISAESDVDGVSRGYNITNVHYVDGVTANAVALNGTFRLGYIGKSGRFVEIA